MIQLIAILIIIEIIIGVYVYRDAAQRGMRAVLWVVVSVLSVPVGLIIYLYVRRRYPKSD